MGSAEAVGATRTPPLHQVVYLHHPGLDCLLEGPPQGSLRAGVPWERVKKDSHDAASQSLTQKGKPAKKSEHLT